MKLKDIFLEEPALTEPKNNDFPFNSKIILMQPNKYLKYLKTSTLKCSTAKAQIGIPPKIYINSCSEMLLIQPDQAWVNLKENLNIVLIKQLQICTRSDGLTPYAS